MTMKISIPREVRDFLKEISAEHLPYIGIMVLKHCKVSEPPGDPIKTGLLGPDSRVSDAVGLEPRMCVSNRFPGDAGTAGPETIF